MQLNNFVKEKCNNLLEAFRVILKALLGLVITSQYCQGPMEGIVKLVSDQYIYIYQK